MISRFLMLAVWTAPLALGACSDEATAPPLTASIVSVAPAGGATDVDVNARIVVVFSHAMQAGMEEFVALHTGVVSGPTVAGVWAWSGGGATLTFTPAVPLEAHTEYTVHLGGGMRATDGGFVDFDSCIEQHGGQWATQHMLSGGMMGPGNMMGPGWRHPNGAYGVLFTFTTA